MKVVEINRDFNTGIAEISGFKKEVRFDLLDEVREGDYVIVHAGFAIQKLSEIDAMETLKLLRDYTAEQIL